MTKHNMERPFQANKLKSPEVGRSFGPFESAYTGGHGSKWHDLYILLFKNVCEQNI